MTAALILLALASNALASSLLVTPTPPSASLPLCLSESYHGSFNGDHVYLPTDDCVDSAYTSLDTGSLVPVRSLSTRGRLVWVGQAGVQGAPTGLDVMDTHWASISAAADALTQQPPSSPDRRRVRGGGAKQEAFAAASSNSAPLHAPLTLVHRSHSSLIVDVPESVLPVLDTLLPAHLVPVGIPAAPLAWEVPEHYAKHLANVTRHLKFDPAVDAIVSSISLDEIRRSVRWLTGEAPSGIVSRHSFTEGALVAADWIKGKVETTGASCELWPFLSGFAPDVLCTYPSLSNSTERVILSAHYDSRGSFGSTRAPGGDDDGSGSGHLLGIADAIAKNNVTFDKSVTLAFFAGEEQGLWGSHYYAAHLAETNATVILQIQADMLAYRVDGEPMQLGLPESIELPEAGWLVSNLSSLYAPELVVGRTSACCSDHQSFVSYGFPATQVFERNDWIADPMYHNSGDLSTRPGYDFNQIVSIAKVTMSALLEVAGFHRV